VSEWEFIQTMIRVAHGSHDLHGWLSESLLSGYFVRWSYESPWDSERRTLMKKHGFFGFVLAIGIIAILFSCVGCESLVVGIDTGGGGQHPGGGHGRPDGDHGRPGNRYIQVPDVREMVEPAAVRRLGYAGLRVEIVPVYDSRFRPGKVLRQSPSPGRRASRGSVVRLYVSKSRFGGGHGGERPGALIRVPNVTGMSES